MVFGSGFIQAVTIGHGTKYKEIIVPKNNKILITLFDLFFVILFSARCCFQISHNGKAFVQGGFNSAIAPQSTKLNRKHKYSI